METKILLTVAILFCIAFTTNAQIDKGRFLLGGNFSIYSAKNGQAFSNSKNEGMNTNIQFGEVVKTNTALGLILSYSYNNSHAVNFPDSNFNKDNEYSVGMFYRKYKSW
jgi:hypothetical protein